MAHYRAIFVKGTNVEAVNLRHTKRTLSASALDEAMTEMQALTRPVHADGVKLFFGNLYLTTVWFDPEATQPEGKR